MALEPAATHALCPTSARTCLIRLAPQTPDRSRKSWGYARLWSSNSVLVNAQNADHPMRSMSDARSMRGLYLLFLVALLPASAISSATERLKTPKMVLPPKITRVLPAKSLSIRPGDQRTIRIEGFNLKGTAIQVLRGGRTSSGLMVKGLRSENNQIEFTLEARRTASTGKDYGLRLDSSVASVSVPIRLEVLGKPAVTRRTRPLLPSRVNTGVLPPEFTYEPRTGASSGSVITFTSAADLSGDRLPSADQLRIKLGGVLLTIEAITGREVRARIPYAPLPESPARLPLTVSYVGTSQQRVVDEFFRFDPARFQSDQASISSIRHVGDEPLSALPWSTNVELEVVVDNFPFKRVRMSDVSLRLLPRRVTLCLGLNKPRVGNPTEQRGADGRVHLKVAVTAFEDCPAFEPGNFALEFRNQPERNQARLSSPAPGRGYVLVPTRARYDIRAREPRRITIQDTARLEDKLQWLDSRKFGRCDGIVARKPVGHHFTNRDTAFRVRSGPVGTVCRYLSHRLRAKEGVRFGFGRAPLIDAPMWSSDYVFTLRGSTIGNSCEHLTSQISQFDRVAPDARYARQPLRRPRLDEYPARVMELRCKGPVEGGAVGTEHEAFVRINELRLQYDPDLDVRQSNYEDFIHRICFAKRGSPLSCVSSQIPAVN